MFTSPPWYVLPLPLPMTAVFLWLLKNQRVSRAGSSSAVSSSSSCIVTSDIGASFGASPPGPDRPGDYLPGTLWRRVTDLVYAICQTHCTVTTVQYPLRVSQCRRLTINLGESRQTC